MSLQCPSVTIQDEGAGKETFPSVMVHERIVHRRSDISVLVVVNGAIEH